MKRSYCILACLMLIATTANAQDDYTPPPMFGAPTPAQAQQLPTKAEPKKATKIEQPKRQLAPEVVEPVPVKKVPVVPSKPVKKETKAVEAPKPLPKVVPEPKKEVITKTTLKPVTVTDIQPPEPAPIPKAMSAKTSSTGVVKGPKVMPAVKKQGVEAEVLYAPTNNKQVGLIDRVQPKDQELAEVEDQEIASLDLGSLPDFTTSKEGEQTILLTFSPSAVTLDKKIQATLKKVVTEFIKKDAQKIQIVSHATNPISDDLSADRRIALSRALAIRGYLTERGIESRYIEVRALGADGNDSPKDRAELTIIK